VTEIFALLKSAIYIDCDFTAKNHRGLSMLAIAIDQMSVAIFDAMLAINPALNINDPKTTGAYLLHLAVQKRDCYFAKHLVNKGIDINLRDENNRTAQDLIANELNQEQWIEAFTPDMVMFNNNFQAALEKATKTVESIREELAMNT
jgi:hypothetical protein